MARRIVTIIGLAVVSAITLGLSPVLLPMVVVLDVLRRDRFALLRAYLFFGVYLAAELAGVAAAFALWLWPSRARWLEHHYRLQRWWVRTLFDSARRLYSVDLEVEGLHHAAAGPLLLLVRHVSVADTLLPTRLLSEHFGLRLRFVLKRDLLFDPCLDIVGQRLPNAFVARGSRDRDEDLRAVRGLAEGLGERDGVMLFPEGTRFTAARRERTLESLERSAPPELVARAQALTRVLPPRLGGVMALLGAAPGLDVVICAHTGFEGTTRLSDFTRGALIGRRIRIAFWRIPSPTIPTGEAERIAWIYEQWARVDAWIADAAGPNPPPPQ